MTEIRFYHLERQNQLQVLPVLITKALERGHKIILKLRDAAEVAQVDDYLWTFSRDSFLPHGSAKTGHADQQPVWLTSEDENPNGADVLIIGEGVVSDIHGDFTLCCEMLNGHDPQEVSAARARWKIYKEKDFEVTYWQQTERGSWEKKA